MSNILVSFLIFITGEIVAFFLFKCMDFLLKKTWAFKINRAVLKGMLERIFLFIALIYHIPQALIAFGAIKIATRFVEEEENKISNDYFYIGNITSLLISLLYYVIWQAVIK